MRPIRVLVADGETSGPFWGRVRRLADTRRFELLAPEGEGEEELAALAREAEAILVYKRPLRGEVIGGARNCRLIQKFGVNCKNIDLAAARRAGIPVETLSLMRNATVAEQAMALLLACIRKLLPGHRAVAEGLYRERGLTPRPTAQWSFAGDWAGLGAGELFGKTAGIIALGDIGQALARRCRAFEMEVIYHQRTPLPPEQERALGVRYCGKEELLRASDALLLVVPHTPETEGLIGAAELSLMKPTAFLVNCARGAVVDEDALAAALRAGRLAGAGLDVFRWEPLPADSPLLSAPNLVLSPHVGGGSGSSWGRDIPAAFENIARCLGQQDA
ncbi:MAG: 2-hydroxyacid dehydrogenase [Nitrospinota bacterium]